ncbi:unnamed protein product [Ectocarpus sp. CCAP 1310/34]|nr:unnamed protein product [Ectocarpus sp. CCAP 1310/34]
MNGFVRTLSLIVLSSVILNEGLSSKISWMAPSGIEPMTYVTETSYLPLSVPRRAGNFHPTTRVEGAEGLGRQDECGPRDARTVSEHAGRDGNCCEVSVCGTLGKTALKSAAILRGGELEPKRHLPPSDGGGATNDARDRSATLLFAEGSSVRAERSKGPRSLENHMGAGLKSANAEDTTSTQYVSECLLPTPRGKFRLRSYRHEGHGRSMEPVVMVAGDLQDLEGVPVRVHDQCLTSEVLGSLRCDCKEQLELALDYISEHGGCVIYMQQEGRGIGLANKVAAYALQDGGLDTVDANRHLGFDDDLRSYEAVEHILADMGIKSIKLMTNNPFKLKCLKSMGIKVLSRIPMLVPPNVHSLAYLRAKAHRMSHVLHQLDDVEILSESPSGGATAPVALPLNEVGAIRGGESTRGSEEAEPDEEGYAFGRDSVLAAIEAVRSGKCVVVTDDEGRENEGDLVFAAEKATEDLLAFTIRHTSGVICASLGARRLQELRLPQMVENNEDPKMTAFAITVDAKFGTSTGISAGDRATTLRALADPEAGPQDFNRPGHIFPLRYTPGGVLERGGHTEAAVDLATLAGLSPVGVLCEITTKDGKDMARVPELKEFCAEHGLVLTSIQDMRCLIRERQRAARAGEDPAPYIVR